MTTISVPDMMCENCVKRITNALTEADLPFRSNMILGTTHSARINTLITDLVKNSMDQPVISMSPQIYEVMNELRDYMFQNIYHIKSSAKTEELKAEGIIRNLFAAYCRDPLLLPQNMQPALKEYGVEQAVCDYIAGMSDRYALKEYQKLFIPRSWQEN